jgi:hypothetical protein
MYRYHVPEHLQPHIDYITPGVKVGLQGANTFYPKLSHDFLLLNGVSESSPPKSFSII